MASGRYYPATVAEKTILQSYLPWSLSTSLSLFYLSNSTNIVSIDTERPCTYTTMWTARRLGFSDPMVIRIKLPRVVLPHNGNLIACRFIRTWWSAFRVGIEFTASMFWLLCHAHGVSRPDVKREVELDARLWLKYRSILVEKLKIVEFLKIDGIKEKQKREEERSFFLVIFLSG